jgi:hypothetical protein
MCAYAANMRGAKACSVRGFAAQFASWYPEVARMRLNSVVFAAVFGLVALSAQAQQVYKWTDENGQVHFSSTPPPKQKVQEVKIRNSQSTPVAPADAAATPAAANAATAGTASSAEQQQAQAQRSAQLKTYCDSINARIATLSRGGARVVEEGPDGSRQALNTADVTARLQAAQADQARYCSAN